MALQRTLVATAFRSMAGGIPEKAAYARTVKYWAGIFEHGVGAARN